MFRHLLRTNKNDPLDGERCVQSHLDPIFGWDLVVVVPKGAVVPVFDKPNWPAV